MPPMEVGGVRVEKKDVLVLAHEERGARKPTSSRCNLQAQLEIESGFFHYDNGT